MGMDTILRNEAFTRAWCSITACIRILTTCLLMQRELLTVTLGITACTIILIMGSILPARTGDISTFLNSRALLPARAFMSLLPSLQGETTTPIDRIVNSNIHTKAKASNKEGALTGRPSLSSCSPIRLTARPVDSSCHPRLRISPIRTTQSRVRRLEHPMLIATW